MMIVITLVVAVAIVVIPVVVALVVVVVVVVGGEEEVIVAAAAAVHIVAAMSVSMPLICVNHGRHHRSLQNGQEHDRWPILLYVPDLCTRRGSAELRRTRMPHWPSLQLLQPCV